MMRARYMVENPDDIVMTARITMTAKEWLELRDQLKDAYPAWQLSGVITEMISDARKVFHASEEGDHE